MTPFSERLFEAVQRTGTPLCVGIDPWPALLPGVGPLPARAEAFSMAVIKAAAGRIAAVKPQFAFFEQLGPEGMAVLARVCAAARAAGLLVIGDAKRGDIGSTAAAYAAATLGGGAPFPCDALTVSPFLGPDTLEPFLHTADATGTGIFVLLRTSNPGSAEWQAPVAAAIAAWLAAEGAKRLDRNGYSPVGAVVGATQAEALAEMRARLPNAWILVPGFGAQGGSAAVTRAAARADGTGALVVSARGATFPVGAWEDDPAEGIRARIDATIRELAGAWGS